MHDETAIYNMLFGEEDLAAKRRQITNDRMSWPALHRDLQTAAKRRSQHREACRLRPVISELEAQLEHESFWLKAKKPVVANPLIEDREFAFSSKIHNLLELAKLAFQTDSTRVMTFSMDWIYGAIKVPGASGGWHTLSHHANKADNDRPAQPDRSRHRSSISTSSCSNWIKSPKATAVCWTTPPC